MVEQAEIVRDVVVVGGGAAGLSAALILARSRRRVTVLDAGAPRNAPTQAVHSLLALDGLSPLELLRRGAMTCGTSPATRNSAIRTGRNSTRSASR